MSKKVVISPKLKELKDKLDLIQSYGDVDGDTVLTLVRNKFEYDREWRDIWDAKGIHVICILDRPINVCAELWIDNSGKWGMWADSASAFHTRLLSTYRGGKSPVEKGMPEDNWWLEKLGEIYGHEPA